MGLNHNGLFLRLTVVFTSLAAASVVALQGQTPQTPAATPPERHLRNIKQLTFDGENAEAYFSFDGRKLTFQSTGKFPCDQIFTMNVDGSDLKLLSSGKGRTTCSHYMPDGKSIVYASTHLGGDACPPVPSRDMGYVWPIYDTYDIFRVNADGTGLRRLTTTPGYDAEATVAKDGGIVFTSVR